MYRVTLYNGSETTIIHEPSVNPRDPHLFTCTLTQGSSGEIDTLQFDILPNNPGYDQMFSRSTLVTVTDLNTTPEKNEFIGRVLTITPQMEESGMVYKTVVCEDRLGYLCDSIQPYIAEDTYTVEDFFTLLLENHNSQVEDYKKIYPGTISVTTSSGNVTKGLNYQTTWDALREKLLNSIGGEIQLYSGTDGLLYLDYVTELGTRDSQTIEIGKNMRSITQSIDPTTVITRLIPLGAKPEITEENPDVDPEDRLTIASVNDGKIYLDDEDAQAVYGIVEGVEYWDDVTLPENLLERGQEWLKNQTIIDSVSLSALDLSLIGLETDSIQRYNYYRTINPAIGLDSYLRVVKRTVDVVEPENISFEMGTQARSLASTLTDASNRASSAAGDAEAAINAELSKTVAVLIASNAQITELEAKVAYIESAYVDYEEVNTLIAEYLYAAIGEFGFLTADEADIRYASIGDLDAVTANITALTAFAETVNVLLGGTGSFDELEAIHLTVENTVIDQAVIEQAVAGTILADLIYADYINTDVINIMSDDGGITIIGNQMQFTNGQIQFYDEDGNLRLQIGQDASGNFTFELYSADGSGVMIDENGVHESAITDGLIIDRMVADDANISGYKLNIEEICSIINTSNGVYTIEAAAVTIDGQQLSAWYTQINEELEGLYGLSSEGLIDYKPYFCLWDSDTDAPPADGELTAAICGTAICGLTICGVTDGILWKENDMPVTDGLYKWVKWKGYYLDGHEEWGDPYCLTDGYLREQTQVLQTGLTVVQGLIDAKVWETDIETYLDPVYGEMTTITENFSELRMTTDEISAQVGEIITTEGEHYLEMTQRMSDIEVTVEGITMTVTNVTETVEQFGYTMDELEEKIDSIDGLQKWTPYWCLWDSGTEAPPNDEDLTPAICGQATCGLTICGVTDGILWKEKEPATQDGRYEWVKYYLEYEDGTTEWMGPYCISDVYVRQQIEGAYSRIEQLADSITMTVADLTNNVNSQIQQLADSIDLTVSDIYGNIADLQIGLVDVQDNIISYINASADVITLTGDRISISSDNFELTYDGEITATKGYIGGFTIGTYKIYGGDPDLNQACVMQVPRGDDESSNRWWVFAAGGSTHDYYGGAPFRVGSDGNVFAPGIRIGNSDSSEEYRLRVLNKYGNMSLSVGNAGSVGLYNWGVGDGEWMCRYYPTDDVNRFGNDARGTEIYGNGISMMTSVTATGSITSGSSSSTSAQRVYAYNSYARVSLSVTDGGLGGIYDWQHGKWIIYTNTSGTVVTNSAIATLAEYDVDDISTLSSATFRDPNHEVVTHVNSHIYKVDGKKHLGLTVNELEAAMKDAGMDPDEYDLTEHWTDEDGNEVGAIRYEELIPMLISEIQSLNDRLDALEEE